MSLMPASSQSRAAPRCQRRPARYGLEETATAAYPERTRTNVLAMGGTVMLGDGAVARINADGAPLSTPWQAMLLGAARCGVCREGFTASGRRRQAIA